MRVLGTALIQDDVIDLTYENGWYCALLTDGWRKYLMLGNDGIKRVVYVRPYHYLDTVKSGKQSVLTSATDQDHTT